LLAKASGQLGKIAGNLNQLGREAHLSQAVKRELTVSHEWLNVRLFPPLYRALGVRKLVKSVAAVQSIVVNQSSLSTAISAALNYGNNLNELTRKARVGQANDLELQSVLRWFNEHLFPAFYKAMGLKGGQDENDGKA
jgi:hypothetical protein